MPDSNLKIELVSSPKKVVAKHQKAIKTHLKIEMELPLVVTNEYLKTKNWIILCELQCILLEWNILIILI